ncbi:MAG: lytic transglycosylase domain-containing protein [Elusimicrobia bacterium]|nr:lytic transglycosylase domain-containing protein [Elusimicrobiota bacterium]
MLKPPTPPASGNGKKGRGRFRYWIYGMGLLFIFPVFLPVNYFWQTTRPWLHKDIIDVHAKAMGIDPVLVLALVRVESGFSPSARSRRGAMGLMQLMPETAREMAGRLGLDPATLVLDDPETNIRLGIKYLDVLRQEFQDDSVALLAAYNAGPTKAREWRRGGRMDVAAITFPETKSFVQRVLATERWIRRLQRVKGFFHA